MHRIVKLLGIIFILGMVSFIICDEKGIKLELDGNHLVFVETKKNTNLMVDEEPLKEEILYKNSDLINLNYEFKHPKRLHKSDGMTPEYLAKLEQEKKDLEEQKRRLEEERKKQVYTGPNIISVDDKNTISSFFQNKDAENDTGIEKSSMGTGKNIKGENVLTGNLNGTGGNISGNMTSTEFLEKYKLKNHTIKLGNLVKIEETSLGDSSFIKYKFKNHIIQLRKGIPVTNYLKIEKYSLLKHPLNLKIGLERPKIKIEKYEFRGNHPINLRTGVAVEHEFIIGEETSKNMISDEVLATLLMDEDIDVDTLESENDEFLQKVFNETKDIDVMNLIVETYLNEYQFVKAKKFIEELPQTYLDSLKPSLNLRVVFNSFSLSSKTTNETLTSLIQTYLSKNEISTEDGNRYLGVLALMKRDYDSFFTIANNFTLESHTLFTSKLQGYKDQISKQMGMPDYYFDTLVALELFNQGFFQPAKVLALYALQKDSNYILPYQILAYSNFLTNSRDTSIEYLKKLVDLDPNNAEKYQFLMGVAYYRNEKYEQSVIMLSLVKSEKLRLDSERYLIRDYLLLNQNNKLIATRNKLLGYDNLVASDFYTYFYEAFFRPYSEGSLYNIYAIDTELADKMIRLCAIRLPKEENVVCNYGNIGKNVALGKFDGLEQSLLQLSTEFPQGYLYHALGEYYLQHDDLEKAKIYLLKAISLTDRGIEKKQIKELLQDAI